MARLRRCESAPAAWPDLASRVVGGAYFVLFKPELGLHRAGMNPSEGLVPDKMERRFWDELRPVWRSWTMRVAVVLLVVGVVYWFRSGGSWQEPPAALRAGVGCGGGFLIGFIFRRLLKAVAILAAVVLGGIALLKGTGMIHLDWATVEQHVHHSLAWTTGKLESFQTFLTGYLPTGGATGWGLFRGVRSRPGQA